MAQAVTQVYYNNATQEFASMGVAIATATLAEGQMLDMAQITSQPFWDALAAASSAPVSDVSINGVPMTVSPYVYSDQPNATVEVTLATGAPTQTTQQTTDMMRLSVAASLGVNVSDVLVEATNVEANFVDAFITVADYNDTQLEQDIADPATASVFVQAMADSGMPAATGVSLYMAPPPAPYMSPPPPTSAWAFTTYATFFINSTAPSAFNVADVSAALAQVSAWPGTLYLL